MVARGFDEDRPRESQDTFRDSLDWDDEDKPPRYNDQAILDEHEEAEELIHGSKGGSKFQRLKGLYKGRNRQPGQKDQKSYRRLSQDVTQMADGNEAFELMHDVDDGDDKSLTESSEGSLDLDREKLAKKHRLRNKSRRGKFARFAGIHTVIFGALVLFLIGAYSASQKKKPKAFVAEALSNGTTLFQPTTLLLSLDGFRADFLNRGITPNLNALVGSGVSPEYMLPSFPSVTFPNHFTLVTGLYPESHAVVGNSFWDPDLQEEFFYTDPARSMFPRFWLAEPVWTTAEAAGVRSAIHMWPGSEAHLGSYEPTYVDKFNKREPLQAKVNRIMELLDLPGPDSPDSSETSPRPQLIAAYVPNVDADGHKFGPNSTEIRNTISQVDDMVGKIIAGIEDRNLSSIVNIIVVSDHGMATTSTSRLVQLDDLIDMSQIEHTDGWPLYGLRPKAGVDINALYKDLKGHAKASNGAFEVYLRDVDMPERYHFSNSPRIAPLWIMPAAGWNIVTRKDFDVAQAKEKGEVYHPRGAHGYDHEHPLMRAIFVARGPAFPHPPGSRVAVFQNIEVYNLLCDSIGLKALPNNGTLRLPLTTDGVHKAIGQGKEEHDLSSDGHEASHGSQATETGSQGWEGLGDQINAGKPQASGTAPPQRLKPLLGDVDEPATTASPNRLKPLLGDVDAASGETQPPAPSASHSQDMTGTPVDTAPNPVSEEGEASPSQSGTADDDALLSAWWKWFLDQVNSVKSWASGSITSHKGEGQTVEGPDGERRPVVLSEEEMEAQAETLEAEKEAMEEQVAAEKEAAADWLEKEKEKEAEMREKIDGAKEGGL